MTDKFKTYFLATLFLIFIMGVSVAGLFISDKEVSLRENRRLNAFPDISQANLKDLTSQIDLYLNDHFAFRDALIDLKEKISDVISGNQRHRFRAVVGKDDWAFFEGCVEHYQGRFSQEKIDIFIDKLSAFAANFPKTPVIVAIIPNKAYIYEDYLPDYINEGGQRKRTVKAVEKIEHIKVLDLLPVLKQESQRQKTYMNYDTHWNGWGAYVAYKSMIDFINAKFNLGLLKREDIASIEVDENFNGGIAAMLGKAGEVFDTNNKVVFTKKHAQERDIKHALDEGIKTLDYFNAQGRKNAVIIHDSFVEAHLGEYLSETFRHSSFYWSFDFSALTKEIKSQDPDLILIEIVDRHIY